MASISLNTFRQGELIHDDDGYLEISFVDNSRKNIRRYWSLYIDYDVSLIISAYLRRSETDEGALDWEVKLPCKMVGTLLLAAKRDGILQWPQ